MFQNGSICPHIHPVPFCLCVWQRFQFSSSSGPPLALSCCLLCSWGWGCDRAPSAIRANMQVKNERNQGLWADSNCVIVSYYQGEMLMPGQLRPHPIFSQVQRFHSPSLWRYLWTVFSTHTLHVGQALCICICLLGICSLYFQVYTYLHSYSRDTLVTRDILAIFSKFSDPLFTVTYCALLTKEQTWNLFLTHSE